MNKKILEIIHRDFMEDQRELVIHELSSIGLQHVMDGDINLENTRLSILQLAKGDVQQVIDLVKSAKIDFRDVIMWASEE